MPRSCEVCNAPATTSEVSVVDNQRYHLCGALCSEALYELLMEGRCWGCMKPEDGCECPTGGWPARYTRGSLREWPANREVVTVKTGSLL